MKKMSLSVSGLPLYSPEDYKIKFEVCFAPGPGIPIPLKLMTYGAYSGIFYRRETEFCTLHIKTNTMTRFTRQEWKDELLRIVATIDPTHALRVAAALAEE